ncbi:hypothetical protein KIKIMORA_00860 [Brevundimonas phage vB_BpoS-Kikimora]|uniref:Uncharacterized protein n=1 Tax=Brevundimonas phage vB_BpoS-Kikimora TaxID=2948601 RepID=A0A9E7MSZ5_9CAUD|nr:hypothetical protein KIKIMORA_00860 [Brevundimonas phage vB_BpoS-Kikimora]
MTEALQTFPLPVDDESRAFSDSLLPQDMIYAGMAALEQADEDNRRYVSGKTIDWDYGMLAVAVYRAMSGFAIHRARGELITGSVGTEAWPDRDVIDNLSWTHEVCKAAGPRAPQDDLLTHVGKLAWIARRTSAELEPLVTRLGETYNSYLSFGPGRSDQVTAHPHNRDGAEAIAVLLRQADKIEGLSTDLEEAVKVAWKRGARDWVRLNYPALYERLSAQPDDQ